LVTGSLAAGIFFALWQNHGPTFAPSESSLVCGRNSEMRHLDPKKSQKRCWFCFVCTSNMVATLVCKPICRH
jgi:hypothetical protein